MAAVASVSPVSSGSSVSSGSTGSAKSSAELAKRPAHDVVDEPSAEWGWHGTLPRGTQLAGWFVALVLFGMIIGNQVGHIEDIYLVLTGVTIVGLLLRGMRRRRDAWRR